METSEAGQQFFYGQLTKLQVLFVVISIKTSTRFGSGGLLRDLYAENDILKFENKTTCHATVFVLRSA